MNCQRRGSDLKTQIRMALSFLGRAQIEFGRMTIAELTLLNSDLSKEVRRKQIENMSRRELLDGIREKFNDRAARS